MYFRTLSESLLAFSFFLLLQASEVVSQAAASTLSTSTTSSTASATSQAPASAQSQSNSNSGNGDGGGVPAGDAQPTNAAGANAAGASGGAGGSLNLSTGTTIAIAVVVSIIVILGIASTVLWFIAKKRQWKVRESISRSVRRVGSAIASPLSPRTPRSQPPMTFPTRKNGGVVRLHDPVPNSLKGRVNHKSIDMTERSGHSEIPSGQPIGSNRPDMEKGIARPTVGRLHIPHSSFDMDSPGRGQVSIWSKVFGRK